MKFRIGVDIGGTFTDAIFVDEQGRIALRKVSSTPADPSIAVMRCLQRHGESLGLTLEGLLERTESIIHGTTVATNTLVQRVGASCGLITTEGTRDILEMRRGIYESSYDLRLPQIVQLVPRYLRVEVRERVSCDGQVVTPLHEEDVHRAIEKFNKYNVRSIVVCFLYSYLYPAHEGRVKEILLKEYPEAYISLSSEILPQVREYGRLSTTAINAYVGPALAAYLRNLERSLRSAGYKGEVLIMQSNGGVMSIDVACQKAVNALISGLAAGPVASVFYGGLQGVRDVIYLEMGGTSFEACLIENGVPAIARESVIGRCHIATSTLDIHTIGAGGGTIASVEKAGILEVGPRSAGADPGPACYDKGGEYPTVTDADLVLGYIDPDYYLGGEIRLNRGLAEQAIEGKVCKPLGLTQTEAASGIFELVNSKMVNAVRAISVERGFDPRDFTMVAAGGACSIHAGTIAHDLGCPRLIIPRLAAGFDALGMLLTDLRHDYVRTYMSRSSKVDYSVISRVFDEMEEEGTNTLIQEGVSKDNIDYTRSVDIRYIRQTHEVEVPAPRTKIGHEWLSSIVEAFHDKHEALYAYSERSQETEIINLRCAAIGKTPKIQLKAIARHRGGVGRATKGRRKAYFPKYGKFVDTAIYDSGALSFRDIIQGPAIVEEPTTTVVISPGSRCKVDRYGNYIVDIPV